jgi:hypothetical protein
MPLQIEVITDIATEPVSLSEAKAYLQIDYSDFDDLITDLIKMARQASEQNCGLAYGEKVIQVTGNSDDERIYPIQPVPKDSEVTWVGESSDGTTDYQYKAGYGMAGETGALPEPLRQAILQRVATAFAKRDNRAEAMGLAIQSSQAFELMYRRVFVV